MKSIMLRLILTSSIAVLLRLFESSEASDSQGQTPQSRQPCPDVEHVCGSLFRVSDKHTDYDSESYCACEACRAPVTWDEQDERALTWYHYERPQWMVQYRFCDVIVPQQTCRTGKEVGAVLRTDTHGWSPRVKKMYCTCANRRYYLQGWTLSEYNYWDYHYTCHQDECKLSEEHLPACVKRYFDSVGEKTIGYRFLCACPLGFSCPTDYEGDELPTIEGEDNNGPYITGYCVEGVNKKQSPHIISS